MPGNKLWPLLTGIKSNQYDTDWKKLSGALSVECNMDGWTDDLQLYILLNSILVISGQWADDNKMLCATEPHLRLRKFGLKWGSDC